MKTRIVLAAIWLSVLSASCLLQPAGYATGIGGSRSRSIARLRRDRAFQADWRRIESWHPTPGNPAFVIVDVARQRLYLFENGYRVASWPVSTSVRGIGQRNGSFRTPVGVFYISRKIGTGLAPNVIIHDQAATAAVAHSVVSRDNLRASSIITTRILWLQGLQRDWNRGGDVDTYLRHIYIHGTPNLGMLGRPASQGCVQMSPWAVISLYRRTPIGTSVLITPGTGDLRRIPGPSLSTAHRPAVPDRARPNRENSYSWDALTRRNPLRRNRLASK